MANSNLPSKRKPVPLEEWETIEVPLAEALKNSEAKMVLQVHDELVFEVPEKEVRDVVKVLEQVLTYEDLIVPLTVKISTGKNWGQMEKYEDNSQ